MGDVMSEWIRVDDRLPITAENIRGEFDLVQVITFDGENVQSDFYQAGMTKEFWGKFEYSDRVTHWQPLPEPPKE